jgi:glutathione S-transferase
MLDSPYVRRTAISLALLGLPFEHRPISVFRQFDEFAAINPVVKAPTLVCDDGEVLMDSGLMLDYAERLAAPRASLVPHDLKQAQHDLRLTGLALAGCEKAVQLVYETTLRPEEKQYAWWLERVRGQLRRRFRRWKRSWCGAARGPTRRDHPGRRDGGGGLGVRPGDAAEVVAAGAHPALVAHGAAAESLPVFRAYPSR